MAKKLAVWVVLLFFGVAVLPCIQQTLRAGASDDYFTVTSSPCGINGCGNTSVRLSKQDCENLRLYLISFNAQVNASSSHEETVALYKDAVRELRDYGLLPKGLSQQQGDHLVLGWYEHHDFPRHLEKFQSSSNDTHENEMCMIRGCTTTTFVIGALPIALTYAATYIFLYSFLNYYFDLIPLIWPFIILTSLLNVLSNVNPLQAYSIICLGFTTPDLGGYGVPHYPAKGWIQTDGLNGKKNWSGSFFGNLDMMPFDYLFYTGVSGFTGIQIHGLFNGDFYIGHALKVKTT